MTTIPGRDHLAHDPAIVGTHRLRFALEHPSGWSVCDPRECLELGEQCGGVSDLEVGTKAARGADDPREVSGTVGVAQHAPRPRIQHHGAIFSGVEQNQPILTLATEQPRNDVFGEPWARRRLHWPPES